MGGADQPVLSKGQGTVEREVISPLLQCEQSEVYQVPPGRTPAFPKTYQTSAPLKRCSAPTDRALYQAELTEERQARSEKAASLQLPPTFHRLLHGDFVGVFDVAADGHSGRDTRHLHR